MLAPGSGRRGETDEADGIQAGSPSPTVVPSEPASAAVHGATDVVVPTTQVPLARTAGATAASAISAATPTPIPDADPNVARVGGVVRMIHRNGDTDGLSISLTPVELGRVKVELMTRDGQLSVHLTADHARGADALRTASGSLRSELEADGVRLDQLGVSLGDAGHGRRDGTPANAGEPMSDNPDTATPRRTGRSVPTDAPSTPRPTGRPRVLTADAVDLDL